MGLLGAIFLFVILSINAACDGDFSGLAAIGKGIGYVLLFVVVALMLTEPVAMVIGIIVIVGVLCIVSGNKNENKE